MFCDTTGTIESSGAHGQEDEVFCSQNCQLEETTLSSDDYFQWKTCNCQTDETSDKFSRPTKSEFCTQRHLHIQKRNARERCRVRELNEAFARLRKIIPSTAHRVKRVSKVKTLLKALEYIHELEDLLRTYEK